MIWAFAFVRRAANWSRVKSGTTTPVAVLGSWAVGASAASASAICSISERINARFLALAASFARVGFVDSMEYAVLSCGIKPLLYERK